MKIDIIVANCFNGGIGKLNKLPFSFKTDLKYFSKMTKGDKSFSNGLLMGRNTWESLPIKPLPYRHNYVISTTMTGDNVFNDIDTCLDHCREQNLDTLWVIGGETIYQQFLFNKHYNKMVDFVHMTKIYKKYDCDKFFPVDFVCNTDNWSQTSSYTHSERGVQLDFTTYKNMKKEDVSDDYYDIFLLKWKNRSVNLNKEIFK